MKQSVRNEVADLLHRAAHLLNDEPPEEDAKLGETQEPPEPNFHVGQIIVTEPGGVCQIVKFIDGYPEVVYKSGMFCMLPDKSFRFATKNEIDSFYTYKLEGAEKIQATTGQICQCWHCGIADCANRKKGV